MSAIATAIVVGGLISGAASSKGAGAQAEGAKSAANAQLTAAQQAEAGINARFEQSRKDLYGPGGSTPWAIARQRGMEGFARITQQYQNALMNPGAYENTAFYKDRLKKTEEAMGRGLSAGGNLDSGAGVKAFGENAADVAALGQQNYLNQIIQGGALYAQQAGLGTPQATASMQAGQNAAGQAGNALMAGGNAAAGGYINQANATTGLYSNLLGQFNNTTNELAKYYGTQSGGGGGYTPSPEYGYGYGR